MNNSKEDKSLIPVLGERLVNGILKENPTFVLLLGMCPTLAVTTSAINGFGMGATTLVVLALSNMMISALRKVIPDKVRIPAFIVIIASFVTMVELLLNAYIPDLYEALGLYIPLIVVNCIILGRAESYAYSNPVLPSLFDGIGMGVGFTLALTIIGGFRELLGNGSLFGARIMPSGFVPVSIFVMAPGAFFVLAILTAIQNAVKIAGTKRGKDMSKIQSGCGGNCLECTKDCKVELISSQEEAEPLETASDKAPVKAGSKAEEVTEKVKAETSKNETAKTEEPKAEESKAEESKKDDAKAEDNKTEEVKSEENKSKEHIIEETATETEPSESVTSEIKVPDTEDNLDTEKTLEQEPEYVESKTENGSEEELELLDLDDYKKAVKKTSAAKKPGRKKTSMAKAKEMLSKADETVKEGNNND